MKDRPRQSLRKAYGKTLAQLGEKDKRIVALDADLSCSTQTVMFADKFYTKDKATNRFFNMGVSEQDMIGTAAGLASAGKIPFASTFAIFQTGRAWEQIRQSISYPKLNVKLVASHGGITVGEDGASHHCIEDIALMRVLPNMKVIIPADAYETEKSVIAAYEHKGPVYIRVSRYDFPVIFDEHYKFTIGQAEVIRDGWDLTFIAAGLMVCVALDAADILAAQGIGARVINMATIKPIDQEIIVSAAQETGAIITAEEHSIIGGLGSAVAEVLGETHPAILKRIGICDCYSVSAEPHILLEKLGLTAKDLAQAAIEILGKKKSLAEYVSQSN
jgi:transketolase